MFGTQNVRVVNDMTWQKRLWFSLRIVSFILGLLAIVGLVIGICVAAKVQVPHTENWLKGIEWLLIVGMVICIPTFAFLTFLFHRLYILDAQLPPKLSNKLQERLKKYEYKHTKKTNNKQNRQANKSLKKDYKKQYKENKL